MIVVEGFDYGIRLGTHDRYFYNPTLEYITLREQNKAGILCEAGSGTLRRIRSENTVPAIKTTDAYTHVAIDEAWRAVGDPPSWRGTASCSPA